MSTKPTVIAAFATSGVVTMPSAAKRAAGFAVDEEPPAQFLNWLHNSSGAWQQYLSDGAFTGGITADTLGVSGLLTASGGIDLAGRKIKHTNHLKAGGLCLWDVVGASGGTPDASATVPGVNIYTGMTVYLRLTIQPSELGEQVNTVTVYAPGATGGTVCTLLTYDENSGGYLAVAGTNAIGFSAGVCTLTPTTPVLLPGAIFALKVVTGADKTLLKYEYLTSVNSA